jgi:hypothetical protein
MRFTFHVPTYNHDEVSIEAKSLEDASLILHVRIRTGEVETVAVDITDTERYREEDAFDCVAFDEDGEQLR